MTTNADIVFSAVRKGASSLVMAFALLVVWSPSWAAESGQVSEPGPGGLEIPPLTEGQEQQPASQPPLTGNQGQPSSQPSLTEGQEQQPASQPPRKDAPREDIVSGTGQSFGGYSGTWHDPTRDETVTTIIAPRQPMVQQPPMYIAPQIYPNWDGSWSQGGGQYYSPQWYPDYRPSRPPYRDQDYRPQRPPYWDQGQRPQRPPYWDQDYRPQRPPYWDQGQRPPSWNPGQRPPSWNPGQRPPSWNPGQRPPSSWNPGQRPPQGGGIPPSWWRGSGR